MPIIYIYIYQFVTIGKLESRRYDARVESQLTIWMILGVISLGAGPPYHASMAKYLSKSSPWPSPVLFDDILPVLYLTITLSVQRLNHKNKKRYVSEPSSLSLSLAMLLQGCCYRWQTTTTRATSPGSSPMVVNSATLHATGGSNHGRGYVLTIPWVTMVEVP